MRLVLKLKSLNSNRIAINYNYALSAAIYKLLKFGSPEFSEFLHEKGYNTNGKIYKLFSFALRFEKIRFEGHNISFISPFAYLVISSPLVDDFVKNIVIGTLKSKTLDIYAEYTGTIFSIEQAELIPEISYKEKMKFKMLSPLILSTMKNHNGKASQYYFRYNDDSNEISRVFNRNLMNKYKVITNNDYKGDPIKLTWDEEYIRRQLNNNKRISKKISITKDLDNIIDLIAIQTPFSLEGNTELIKVGYECGFGEKNSMGFGLVEAVN